MKDRTVNIAKGWAIILMVLGHTEFNIYGEHFIYMFHMPLFFMLSGYCFKDSYLSDFKKFFIRRVKGAYLPYVKFSLIFLILHNLLFRIHFYDGTPEGLLYKESDCLALLLKIVGSMTGADLMLGGFWFLHTYFFASFIFYITVWFVKNKTNKITTRVGYLLVTIALFALLQKVIPGSFGRLEILASLFMIVGYGYKKSNLHFEHSPFIVAPLCAVLIAIGATFWSASMPTVTLYNIVPYYITSLAGFLMVFSVSRITNKFKIAEFFSYVGDRTLDILAWHFLSFKIVSCLVIITYGLSMQKMGDFPIIKSYSQNGWWILYTTIGVLLPLFINKLLSITRKWILLKLK